MAETARLESVYRVKPIGGSNPPPSASFCRKIPKIFILGIFLGGADFSIKATSSHGYLFF